MVDITRRGFLTSTSLTVGAIGVGLAGGLGVRQMAASSGRPSAPGETTASAAAIQPAAPVRMSLAGMQLPESMVVHVRDAATGEISVMVGTQEVVLRDQDIVARLVQAAGPAVFEEG